METSIIAVVSSALLIHAIHRGLLSGLCERIDRHFPKILFTIITLPLLLFILYPTGVFLVPLIYGARFTLDKVLDGALDSGKCN